MLLRQFRDFYYYNRNHTKHYFLLKVSDGKLTIPLCTCKGSLLERKVIAVDEKTIRIL